MFQPNDEAVQRAINAFYGRDMPAKVSGLSAQRAREQLNRRMAEALNAAMAWSDVRPVDQPAPALFDKADWLAALHMASRDQVVPMGFMKDEADVFYRLIQEGPST